MSPSRRGSALRDADPPFEGEVCPAPAGMSPPDGTLGIIRYSLPRTRGDEPMFFAKLQGFD